MGDISIRKALDDYKTIYMPYRNFAERTREEYSNDLENFAEFAERSGICKVGEVGPRIIHRYVAGLEEKGFSAFTRRRKVVAIRSFLSFLCQDGYIAANIGAKIIVPFVEISTPHILTRPESERLQRASAQNPRDFALIELLLETGLRLSELVRLTLDDLEIRTPDPARERCIGSIRIVAGRGKKERIVPINARASLAIEHYLSARKGVTVGTFFLNRFGEPLGKRGVQKVLRKYLTKAEIRYASIHILRHTYAARKVAEGTHLKILQEMMGLKNRRSVSIYASLARA